MGDGICGGDGNDGGKTSQLGVDYTGAGGEQLIPTCTLGAW